MTTLQPLKPDDLEKLGIDIEREMRRGLESPGQPLRMLHSYVDHFPTGSEKGNFLTIDFGGTNLRVMHVNLLGNGRMECKGEKWIIPENKKKGCTGEELFEWIADCVLSVATIYSSVSFSDRLGFCFSFPLHQRSIKSAILLQWNKGFDIPSCIGQDVAVLLDHAFTKKGSSFRVGALVNDTVAVLLARSYENRNCQIGAVLGTGFNAAYWEEWSAVPKLANDKYAASMRTIINTEMGGMPLALCEQVDRIVDQQSLNPSSQLFEKRVSGMYLGLMFKCLCEINHLSLPDYSTHAMSMIEEGQQIGHIQAKSITDRSVQYVACCLAAIYKRIQSKSSAFEIAIEGSVIEHYHQYMERLDDCLNIEFGINNISIIVVDDYSAIGSAVAASMSHLLT